MGGYGSNFNNNNAGGGWGGNFNNINMQAALAGQVAQSVRGESVGVNPKDTGNLTGPTAAVYMSDHENLAITP
jgi:hypothetical protein